MLFIDLRFDDKSSAIKTHTYNMGEMVNKGDWPV